MIVCDRCGGPTKPKTIVSKKPQSYGKTYELRECLGECISENSRGKFPYSFFPLTATTKKMFLNQQLVEEFHRPKELPVVQVKENKEKLAATKLLKEILDCLIRIEDILANPTQPHISKSELEPDESVPF